MRNPSHYSWRDVKRFPFAGIVMHQAGVQEAYDRVLGSLSFRFENFININSVMRAAVVFSSILDVLPKNLEFS